MPNWQEIMLVVLLSSDRLFHLNNRLSAALSAALSMAFLSLWNLQDRGQPVVWSLRRQGQSVGKLLRPAKGRLVGALLRRL